MERLEAAKSKTQSKRSASLQKLECLCLLAPERYRDFAAEFELRMSYGGCAVNESWRMCDEYIHSGLWTASTMSSPAWETSAEKQEILRALRERELRESEHPFVLDGNARPFALISNLTNITLGFRFDIHADPTTMNFLIDGVAAWQVAQVGVVANDEQTEEQAALDAFRQQRAIADIKRGKPEVRQKLRLTQIRLRLYKRLGLGQHGSNRNHFDVIDPWLFPQRFAAVASESTSRRHRSVQRVLPCCCLSWLENHHEFQTFLSDRLH